MNMFPIPITAMYAGLLGIMLVAISIRVTVARARTKIMFGDGGSDDMTRIVRTEGNFIEYVPLALILIGIVEWMAMPPAIIHALGAGLLAARLIHAWGLKSRKDIGRATGATITWIVLFAGSALALYGAWGAPG